MREELGSSSQEVNRKKNSKSRRRLHEAEVLSTTPCTAPVRKPQLDSSNHLRSSLRGLSLNDNNQQLPPTNSISSSVGGTVDEYNRISNKTGGFEGALPLQYDAIFPNDDNNTVHFDVTVKSSPELGQKAVSRQKMNGGRDTASTRKRLFQRQQRSSVADDSRIGFFRRWTGRGTVKKDQNLSSSSFGTLSQGGDKQPKHPPEIRPPKLRLSSRGTTSVTIAEDNSELSLSKSMSNMATPSRAGRTKGSPRFILPDETPPGSKSTSRKDKGSDNTSAAVIARRSQSSPISDDQGFELSVSSAPPAYSTPRKKAQQRNTVPVDLDEVDGHSSSDESSPRQKRIPEKESSTRNKQNHSTVRVSSVSPIRKRMPFSPSKSSSKSRSAHARLGISLDSDDNASKFSVEHLGALPSAGSLRLRQSSSESERENGYGGLKRWMLPMKRTGRIVEQKTQPSTELHNTANGTYRSNATNDHSISSSEIERQYQSHVDEVQSLSADQRESIFANMELVEKESSASENTRRSKSTVKSTSYTQSTTSSSKDAPVVRLPTCVVCNFHDRTHIAVPCMHFAYCRECSMRLAKLGKGCVLCNNQQVTFAAVSV